MTALPRPRPRSDKAPALIVHGGGIAALALVRDAAPVSTPSWSPPTQTSPHYAHATVGRPAAHRRLTTLRCLRWLEALATSSDDRPVPVSSTADFIRMLNRQRARLQGRFRLALPDAAIFDARPRQ